MGRRGGGAGRRLAALDGFPPIALGERLGKLSTICPYYVQKVYRCLHGFIDILHRSFMRPLGFISGSLERSLTQGIPGDLNVTEAGIKTPYKKICYKLELTHFKTHKVE